MANYAGDIDISDRKNNEKTYLKLVDREGIIEFMSDYDRWNCKIKLHQTMEFILDNRSNKRNNDKAAILQHQLQMFNTVPTISEKQVPF